MQIPDFAAESPDYEADYYAWSQEQARRIRMLRIPGVDIENIAEEIESLGRSDTRSIRSRLAVLLLHLLKYQYQSARRGRSWTLTIREQRHQINGLLDESPSLRPRVSDWIDAEYRFVAQIAAAETRLSLKNFPKTCEWTPNQILDEDFLPGDPEPEQP